MKRTAVARICGWSFVIVLSISVTDASAQYYAADQNDSTADSSTRQPLDRLPPIVTSESNPDGANLEQVKELFLPPIVANSEEKQETAVEPIPATDQPPGRFSATGVPIYSRERHAAMSQMLQPGNPTERIGRTSFVQGSGSRNIPIIQGGNSATSLPPIVVPNAASTPMQEPQGSIAPGDIPPAVPEIEIEAPESVFETPPSSGTPGTNDYFDASQPAPVTGGGVPAGNTGCASCGPNGCYDLDQVQAQMGCCGAVVQAGWYGFFDILGYSRGDGDVQLSTFAGLNDFGGAGGVRFTLGYRRNATIGRELTFFGTGKLGESVLAEDPTNGLFPTFTATDGFNFGDVSAFFNASTHFQTKETQIIGVELNRVEWAWDLFKTIAGFRYLYFRDNYLFWSANPVSNGLFTMDGTNNLFGANLGFELFYDVGYRTSFSFINKYGLYLNAAKFDTNLFNANVRVLEQETTDSSLASSIDLSFMGHFQLAPRARLRASGDFLLIWGAFTVENNAPRETMSNGNITSQPVITPQTGSDLNTTNQPVFFNGFSIGFEFFR